MKPFLQLIQNNPELRDKATAIAKVARDVSASPIRRMTAGLELLRLLQDAQMTDAALNPEPASEPVRYEFRNGARVRVRS